MRTMRTVLLATAAVSAALGVAFLLLPPAMGDVSTGSVPTDSVLALPAIAAADPALAEDIVLANAFSARRTPPTSRYTPQDAATDSSDGAVAGSMTMAGAGEALAGEPRLLGTVVGARGAQALLQLDPYAGAPRLYAVGERDGGYRVISIAPRTVVLAGPRGRVTLRLDPEEERP